MERKRKRRRFGKSDIKEIIANHGIPQSIISNRDKLFTSKFWNTWTQQLGTKVKLLTAYHPRTDGQTKQTNQTLEQYLRQYINFKQNNWIDLLPLAQFVYNNNQHSTTKILPFYANYGKHPNWDPNNNITTSTSEAATTKINKIVKLHEKLNKRVNQGGKNTAKQVNKKRLKGQPLRGGTKSIY